MKNQLPLVAIIGRTNVGKSTLFNRLVGDRRALVSSIAGTTRDSRRGQCDWAGTKFTVVDTAGLDVTGTETIDQESIKMAQRSIVDANLVILLVDGRAGFTTVDKEYAKMVLRAKKTAILAINKVDSFKQLHLANDFYKSGIKNIEIVSAKNGSGTGDLLDAIMRLLDLQPSAEPDEVDLPPSMSNDIRVAIIGKPNVGKSSLFNKIIGEERSIVSPIPHTTRDSQDVTIEYAKREGKEAKKHRSIEATKQEIKKTKEQAVAKEQTPAEEQLAKSDDGNQLLAKTESDIETDRQNYRLTFIDTAGLIKQRKINDKMHEISMAQSHDSMKKADVVLLVIDATENVTQQDKHLAQEILDSNRSIIFVINKWDEVDDKDNESDQKYIEYLHRSFPFLTWAPVIFVSALTGFKVSRLIDTVIEVAESQRRKFTEADLKYFLHKIIRKKSPPRKQGLRPPYIHSISQLPRRSLVFVITANETDQLVVPYLHFIGNALREEFKLWGCGIRLILEEAEGEGRKS